MDESSNEVSLTCEKCGATFTAFLRQMAQHNQKVVCPKCGHPRPQLSGTGAPQPAKSRP